jgi:hypothetical protein
MFQKNPVCICLTVRSLNHKKHYHHPLKIFLKLYNYRKGYFSLLFVETIVHLSVPKMAKTTRFGILTLFQEKFTKKTFMGTIQNFLIQAWENIFVRIFYSRLTFFTVCSTYDLKNLNTKMFFRLQTNTLKSYYFHVGNSYYHEFHH